ncbi:MAG: hypothetical protein JRI56_00215 [Deltaproteobacteria bacterium]|nr:hypothetical protein [Deltaproteobacteria bacterium]
MPQGIGYNEAPQKLFFFGRKKKKKKKKEEFKTDRTKDIEKRLRQAGFTEEEIKRLRGKRK